MMKKRDYDYAQKVITVDQLKSWPSEFFGEVNDTANEVVAVNEKEKTAFYMVPVDLFEDMVDLCEYAQRSTLVMKSEVVNMPGDAMDMNALSDRIAKSLKNITANDKDDFEEWT
ncbi:type II toxin-antitoxin system Phd/YefM family antitoxin [Sessilibacter sp. MAH4]